MKESSDKKGFSNMTDQLQLVSADKSCGRVEGPINCVQTVEESADAIRIRAELQEARLAEERIRDRLAAAARERLAKVSKEKQLQMERKRKAAMFLSMLHKSKGENSNLIGPRLPTSAELEIISNGDGDKPLSAQSDGVFYQSVNVHTAPLFASSSGTMLSMDNNDSTKDVVEVPIVLNVKEQSKKSSAYSHNKKSRHQDRSKSRSRSRSRSRRRRSRSSSSERRHKKRNRSRDSKRRRSSSSPESKSKKYGKRKSSRTPPASYMRVRNSSSSSPHRRSRSKSRSRHKRHSRS